MTKQKIFLLIALFLLPISLKSMEVEDDQDSQRNELKATIKAKLNMIMNSEMPRQETPLMRACINGDIKKVRKLVEDPFFNVKINIQDEFGSTALQYAINNGHTKIVDLLLQQPWINVNSQDDNGMTALMWAAAHGRTGIVTLLLQHPNINVHLKDKYGSTAYDMALRNGHEDIVWIFRYR